jgi:hypothetical protein
MTRPLSDSELEWAEMKSKIRRDIEQRLRPHKFDVLDLIGYVVLALVIMYGSWMAGRWYEARAMVGLRAEISRLEAKAIQAYYGPRYFYFEWKGQTYFVKDKKDLDNEKKWIKADKRP